MDATHKGNMMMDLKSAIETDIQYAEKEVQQARAKLDALKQQLERVKFETEERYLAHRLHETTCNWNHTDGCGWFYEFKNKRDDWDGHDHKRYLEKASKLKSYCDQSGVSVDSALETYKFFTSL